MKCLLFLLFASVAYANRASVEPEYISSLLREEKYEEVAKLMGIENVDLLRPTSGNSSHPMFNKALEFGDIVPLAEDAEKARQGINFERYAGSKWPNNYIPYVIDNGVFLSWKLMRHYFEANVDRDKIYAAALEWNRWSDCLKLYLRRDEPDYVYVFHGNGCWSYLGRTGGWQLLSLQQNGCMWQGTIMHEFDHAAGFAHEHNRHDRDDHIKVLWHNIPEEWKSQYEKTNPRDYGLQQGYDYYSIMHYPYNAPGTNRPAFEVPNWVETNRMGRANTFTWPDVYKLNDQYC